MSELATLARPYAVAVFKRAKETDSAAKWSDMLSFITAVVGNSQLQAAVKNPKLGKDKLLALILDICQGQLNDEAVNFLKLLVSNSRLSLLPGIRKNFELLKAEKEGYIDVDVVTAYAFTKEGRQNFALTLEKTLNKKIHMNVTVDKSLIGGVLVRAGDRVIDGSVRGQLQHLQKALL